MKEHTFPIELGVFNRDLPSDLRPRIIIARPFTRTDPDPERKILVKYEVATSTIWLLLARAAMEQLWEWKINPYAVGDDGERWISFLFVAKCWMEYLEASGRCSTADERQLFRSMLKRPAEWKCDGSRRLWGSDHWTEMPHKRREWKQGEALKCEEKVRDEEVTSALGRMAVALVARTRAEFLLEVGRALGREVEAEVNRGLEFELEAEMEGYGGLRRKRKQEECEGAMIRRADLVVGLAKKVKLSTDSEAREIEE
ncbi:hypothetical protein BJ508DRAFT_419545 [Ascobolus immersus RN42]|uniref:Uncharacterized protein n=1 Tax=Ascobolus immersus RN42 TaxID=1160509 RepID=A0A3N4HD87_ASCIM|nr:hypothetical protein BJ508DRAFT_419545 [Ascobolus immersus RN42]